MELWYPQDRGRLWSFGNARRLFATTPKIYKVGYVFSVPETGTIISAGFNLTEVANSKPIKIGLEIPVESILAPGGGPPGSTDDLYGGCDFAAIAAPAAGWNEADFATPAEAVAGDIIALSIQFTATEGDLNLGGAFPLDFVNSAVSRAHGFPTAYYVYGTHVNRSSSFAPMLSLKYSTPTGEKYFHVHNALPITGAGHFDLWDDANNERGNVFRPPVDMIVKGIYFIGQILHYAPFKLVLYNSDGDELIAKEVQTMVFHSPGYPYSWYQFGFPEVDLSEGQAYYLTIKQNGVEGSGTPHIYLGYFDVNTAALMGAMPGGDYIYGVKRPAAGGAWTEEPTRRYRIGLIADVPGAQPGNFAHAAIG